MARLHSWHSDGMPLQLPPKDLGKQEPTVAPRLFGPTYLTWHPPPLVQLYLQSEHTRSVTERETAEICHLTIIVRTVRTGARAGAGCF